MTAGHANPDTSSRSEEAPCTGSADTSLLLLVLAGLALTGAGCSGSGGSDTGAGAGGSSVFDVVFADKDGTTISDR